MKKLSLVLALILVLTCAVLAACGGDDTSSSAAPSNKPVASSKVESSVASSSTVDSSVASSSTVDSSVVESSTVDSSVVESSSEAASSEVESSEAASSEVESSSEAASSEVESSEVESSEVESSDVETSQPETSQPAGEGTNVALGKSYDAKGYKAGGEWPADYTANLTDGAAATELTFDNNWFAFCPSEGDNGINAPDGVGAVTIDLGSVTNITAIKVNTLMGDTQNGSGINAPAKMVAYVDGVEVGAITTDSKATDGAVWWTLNTAAKGQNVKVEVTLNGTFAFINEIEVYN